METRQIVITRVRVEKDGWAVVTATDENNNEGVYTGAFVNPVEGMRLIVTGEEIVHRTYGPQFKVESSVVGKQQSKQGVYNYLLKADIRGLGAGFTQKIVAAFGDKAIDIIRNDWMQLTIIKGISDKRALMIHEGEAKTTPLYELLSFEGITYNRAEQLYKKYGLEALNILRTDTYRLIYEVDGIGFKTADKIAIANGADPNGYERVAAAITFRLNSIGDEGHCYETYDEMVEGLKMLIPTVEESLIKSVLGTELLSGRVVSDGEALYSSKMYEIETETAKYIKTLLGLPAASCPQEYIDQSIADIEEKLSKERCFEFLLEDQQREAVKMGVNSRLSVITGGAGTGKTTIIRAIAGAYLRVKNSDVVLCAPTGKAAKRMEEATGHPALTVHRLIMREGAEYPEHTILICDESSMMDIIIANRLLAFAVKHGMQVVFVGDVHQLPPVGPGMFFRDLLSCSRIPKSELTLCHRQQGNIAINAHHVNLGFAPKSLIYDNNTTKFIYAVKTDAVKHILEEYTRCIKKYGVQNVCVIGPIRKAGKSPTSTADLNNILRNAVNSEKPGDSCKFAAGDRVMNLKNDKDNDIYNGDTGVVVRCNAADNDFVVDVNGERKRFPLSKQEQWDLAYAMSVHKSQGSGATRSLVKS